MVLVYALAQLVHVAAVLAHGALGDAALFLPVAILEVLRERFRRFRGAFGGSLTRYVRLLAEFLQVILMRGILASGEIEHLSMARLRWLWRCSAKATSSQAASSPASRRTFAAMRAAIS